MKGDEIAKLAVMELEVQNLKADVKLLKEGLDRYDKAAAKMGGIAIALIGVFSVILYGWESLKDKLIGLVK